MSYSQNTPKKFDSDTYTQLQYEQTLQSINFHALQPVCTSKLGLKPKIVQLQ